MRNQQTLLSLFLETWGDPCALCKHLTRIIQCFKWAETKNYPDVIDNLVKRQVVKVKVCSVDKLIETKIHTCQFPHSFSVFRAPDHFYRRSLSSQPTFPDILSQIGSFFLSTPITK